MITSYCTSLLCVRSIQTKKKLVNFFSYNKTMTTRTKELEPGFRRSKMAEIRGTRTLHVVTFNPNKASPGKEIYIDMPKLKADACLVPDSLDLQFDFKNANTKSWFLNNPGPFLRNLPGGIFQKGPSASLINLSL